MLYSEGDTLWEPLPPWVQWFLQFGYEWPLSSGPRRICIVSTPCDSPAAGLVALGAMRRRLEVPGAGDLATHLQRLRNLYKAEPEHATLRRINNKRRFRFARIDPDGTLWVHPVGDGSERFMIIEDRAADWYIDGEPPLQTMQGLSMAAGDILRSVVRDALPILSENLRRTDSAVCLAGRIGGERYTQQALSTVKFKLASEVHCLGELLTIHGWHEGQISRVMFYNTRTRALDRQGSAPLLVCTDGAAAFNRVHADSRFVSSDVIAVIPRTSDQDQIEAVTAQLASLSQWYTPENLPSSESRPVPYGVAALILKRD